MRLKLKKVKDYISKIFNKIRNNPRNFILLCTDIVLATILFIVIIFSIYDCNMSKENKQYSSENANLSGFVQDNQFNNWINEVDNIYIILDNSIVIKSNSTDKWITVAPLIIEFDRYSDNTGNIYLNYPIITSNTNYKYNRIQLNNNSPITIEIACYVASYSSDLWSVSVSIDYSLDYNTFLYSSSYSKTVIEFNENNAYGLTNNYRIIDDNISVIGYFNLKQIDGLSTNQVNYYYDYSNIPINKLVCESYVYGFNTGYEEGKNYGEEIGYSTGYNDGFSNYIEDNPFNAISTGLNSLLNVEIVGGFTVGDTFWICVGIVFFSLFMKIFRF